MAAKARKWECDCKFDGCPRPAAIKGYCESHDAQMRRRGWVGPLQLRSIHDRCRYNAAHQRVAKLWGSANQFPCIECGRKARTWAYDGTDPTELLSLSRKGGNYCFYSRYPEFYMPLCDLCHNRRDRSSAKAELNAYRQWKHAIGLQLGFIDMEAASVG